MIIEHSKDLFTIDSKTAIFGSSISTRMTIIRLSNGRLILFDPIEFDIDLKNEIDLLGDVCLIIAPNKFHYLYISVWAKNYPNKLVLVAPGLPERIKDMKKYNTICDGYMIESQYDIIWFLFDAIPALNEVILYHESSRTLILTDLVFNLHQADWSLLGIYIRFSGTFKKLGLTRLLKLLVRDKARARKMVDYILELDFERIIMAHGEIIEKEGKKQLEAAFSWL